MLFVVKSLLSYPRSSVAKSDCTRAILRRRFLRRGRVDHTSGFEGVVAFGATITHTAGLFAEELAGPCELPWDIELPAEFDELFVGQFNERCFNDGRLFVIQLR